MNIRAIPLTLPALVFLVISPNNYATTLDSIYNGFNIGVSISQQNIIAGSFVNDTDFLVEDEQLVTSFDAAWRYQFSNNILIGVELQYGRFDGELSLNDTDNALVLNYDGNKQTSFGMHAGFVTGDNQDYLLHIYAQEITRKFSVDGTFNQDIRVSQRDEQGLLHYGFGIEKIYANGLGLKFRVGTFRADFGDVRTNIDISKPVELSIGINYQF